LEPKPGGVNTWNQNLESTPGAKTWSRGKVGRSRMATLLCWAWSCPLILLFLASHAQAGLLTKADNEGMKGVDTMEGLVQVDDLDRMSQVEDMDRMAQVDDMEGLVQAHVVFRHGDRTPCNFYPNDPHKDLSEWPVGPGQLTARGKRMHYHLGQWLRKRYSHLLGPDYSETEVLVRSTDVDRTLMSAQSNLAGMFPPTKSMRWLDNFNWQHLKYYFSFCNKFVIDGSEMGEIFVCCLLNFRCRYSLSCLYLMM